MPFPELAARLAATRERIAAAASRGGRGQTVEIVAVTKTHGAEAVESAWAAGLRIVGENKVQEALEKMPGVTVPVAWHLIGHLQRNKVKYLDSFALLHSLDSLRLAEAVHEHGTRRGAPVEALVQVNASGEASKGGFSLDDLRSGAEKLRALHGVRVRGVMTMAPFDADERVIRQTFAGAREAGRVLREAGHEAADGLSMGMSGDYEVAVEEGATLVRLGTILFGDRGTTA